MFNKHTHDYNWKTTFTLLTVGVLLAPLNEMLLNVGPGTLGDSTADFLLVPLAWLSWPLLVTFVGLFLSSNSQSTFKKALAILSIPTLAIVSLLLLLLSGNF